MKKYYVGLFVNEVEDDEKLICVVESEEECIKRIIEWDKKEEKNKERSGYGISLRKELEKNSSCFWEVGIFGDWNGYKILSKEEE